jgi:chitin synthase
LSWGTKGADTVQASDLGAVHGVGKHVEVELVSAQQDIDSAYQDALDNIRLKRAKVDVAETNTNSGLTEQQQKDVYVSVQITPQVLMKQANFRTNVSARRLIPPGSPFDVQLLLLWSLSNALLASVILSGGSASSTFSGSGDGRTAVYMLIVLSECIRAPLEMVVDSASLCGGNGCFPLCIVYLISHSPTVCRIDYGGIEICSGT